MAEEHEDDAVLLYPEDAADQNDDGDEAEEDSASADSEMTLEPESDRANSMSFYTLCKKMETLWNQRKNRKRKKVTEEQKKKYLLPSELLKKLEPQSIFPLMRLLVPDQDNARNCKMKESKIAQAYCGALGFNKGTSNYEMLYGFTDPQKVPHQLAGDLSLVVHHVMTQRLPKDQSSRCTLGQINQYLDELAEIGQAQRGKQNHGWREAASSSKNKKKVKKQTQGELRARWLRKINNKACLSPLVSIFSLLDFEGYIFFFFMKMRKSSPPSNPLFLPPLLGTQMVGTNIAAKNGVRVELENVVYMVQRICFGTVERP